MIYYSDNNYTEATKQLDMPNIENTYSTNKII